MQALLMCSSVPFCAAFPCDSRQKPWSTMYRSFLSCFDRRSSQWPFKRLNGALDEGRFASNDLTHTHVTILHHFHYHSPAWLPVSFRKWQVSKIGMMLLEATDFKPCDVSLISALFKAWKIFWYGTQLKLVISQSVFLWIFQDYKISFSKEHFFTLWQHGLKMVF